MELECALPHSQMPATYLCPEPMGLCHQGADGETTFSMRVAANILINQSLTADKGWSSSLGVGQGAYSSSLWKRIILRAVHIGLGPGLILCYDIVTVGCSVILPVCSLLEAECRKCAPCVLVLKLVTTKYFISLIHFMLALKLFTGQVLWV